ncbi:MAG: hypothetical protein V3V08_05705 [Nannocystaceae bacterium]
MGDLGYDLSRIGDDQLKQGGKGVWYVKPDGWYRAMISAAVIKPNKAGTGKVMHAKLAHLDPQYADDFEMAFVNVQHPKEKVQEIGQAELKSLALATGHPNPNCVQDTSELLNKPFMLKLYSEAEDSKYSDADGRVQRIAGYLSSDELMAREGDIPQSPPAQNSAPQEPAGFGDDIPF